jgi:molecular chaperone GrpE
MAAEEEIVAADIVEDDAPEDAGSPLVAPAAATPGSLGIDLPEDHDQALEVLTDAVATARAAADRYLDDLQRIAADYENYRKRVQRDREEIVERATQRVIESLLPVLDSFDQAFVHEAHSPGEEKLLAGVRSTFHQLMDVLGKEGLEMVPGADEPFDPNVHEAVSGGGDGELVVAQEMRRGYTLKGRVVRPALVAVAPREPAAEGGEGPGT